MFDSVNDIFVSIASKWRKIPEIEVSEKIRNDAKKICYGIIYGMGLNSLAESLKMDENDAKVLLELFHSTYPGIRLVFIVYASDYHLLGWVGLRQDGFLRIDANITNIKVLIL